MSRTVFLVLAVLALLVSVSAQSSSSSSWSRLSSSSSSAVVAASTGSSSGASSTGSTQTGGSPDAYPSGSYALSFVVQFTETITSANVVAVAVQVQADIAYNLANGTGINSTILEDYVVITSIGGTSLAPLSRRLLQTGTAVTWVLLGNITQVVSILPATLVSTFVSAAANGTLAAPNTGATIPAQTLITPVAVGSTPVSSSSSTGLGDSGAFSQASSTAALLVAAVAALALLL